MNPEEDYQFNYAIKEKILDSLKNVLKYRIKCLKNNIKKGCELRAITL